MGPRPSPETDVIGQIFPPDNPWNTDVSSLPVHANSENFIHAIGESGHLHPDFGTTWRGKPIGIPFNIVRRGQPLVPISFEYASQSEEGPYPIPPDASIEAPTDGHVIVLDVDARKLYEVWNASRNPAGGWLAGSGAVFDLTSNALRPVGWTSADGAGLPIFPGLVRYDEAVTAGVIPHALRFTVQRTQRGFISPARHFASHETDPNVPPMGLRLRLKSSLDDSDFPPAVRVILAALKRYGMILADNGSNWFLTGTHDPRWNDRELAALKQIRGADFEVVDTGPVSTRDW